MGQRIIAATLVVSGMLGLPSLAAAQHWKWGHEREPQSGICFYKDPDFRGEYFCARDGESERDMPRGMNDKISSIRIFGDSSITVFQDSRFEGRSTRFDYDVPDLHREGWNDLISSFRVSGGYGHHHGKWWDSSSDNGGRSNYRGNPDDIVRRAYQDVLNREPDDRGLRIYRSHIIDDGWSEAQVRQSLKDSREFREMNTMTFPRAQQIVRSAYINVLRREPDSGAQGYLQKVMREGWTQQDVEKELRKSREYRDRR